MFAVSAFLLILAPIGSGLRAAPFWVATEYCRAAWRKALAVLKAERNMIVTTSDEGRKESVDD